MLEFSCGGLCYNLRMKKTSITLYTMAWGGFWEKYGESWINQVLSLATKPEEIVIVTEKPIDCSKLNFLNVKNIVHVAPSDLEYKTGHYRNIAIANSTSEWIVASDIDDVMGINFLCNIDNSAEVHGFSFLQKGGELCRPNENSLNERLSGSKTGRTSRIPGTSAIKKHIFNNIRYEDGCFEDAVLYATLSTNKKISYSFDSDKNEPRFYYSGWTFSDKNKKDQADELNRVSNVYTNVLSGKRDVYAFWFSGNMADNRLQALKTLRESCGVNLVLIDNEKFYNYENKEIPIHKAFQYLSDVHKSDYARVYMMYFYGQGYTDVKRSSFDWNEYFEKLFYSRFDAIGYAEKKIDDVAKFTINDESFSFDKLNYKNFAGNGHYIFKPKTFFAKLWLLEIHKILDNKIDLLQKNPGTYHPRAVPEGIHNDLSSKRMGYPIEWNEINGRIKHRLEYLNNFSNFMLEMPYVNTDSYL